MAIMLEDGEEFLVVGIDVEDARSRTRSAFFPASHSSSFLPLKIKSAL